MPSTRTVQASPESAGLAEELRLLAEFPVPRLEEWRREAVRALKGVPFDKKMSAPTREGIALKALYTPEDVAALPHVASLPGDAPFVRGTTPLGHRLRPWEVAQELPYPSAGGLAEALREDLAEGQDAAVLVLDEAGRAGLDPAPSVRGVGARGTSIADVADLLPVLSAVPPGIPVHLRAGPSALPAAALLAAAWRAAGRDGRSLRGSVALDPHAALLSPEASPFPLERLYDHLAALTLWAASEARSLSTFGVHAAPVHEAGGDAVQELAFAAASAVASLRALERRGVGVEAAASRAVLGLSVGPSLFLEIAKLRAARLLWTRLLEGCGAVSVAGRVSLHARVASYDKTAFDVHVNVLRGTTEAFSAICGGCDVLHVPPFDEPLGVPSERARRLARQTQLVLREECRLDHVVDPSGGSWAVETLTAQLAEKAWDLFREIERRGGLAAALADGWFQARVEATAADRSRALATLRESLVGTNAVPNALEGLPERPAFDAERFARERAGSLSERRRARPGAPPAPGSLAGPPLEGLLPRLAEAAGAGATLGELVRSAVPIGESVPRVVPLEPRRAAQPFEALREAVLSRRGPDGRRPRVFLAAVGRAAELTARLDFTRAFLSTGGFELAEGPPCSDAVSAAAAALADGAGAVAIVSTDERYPELVPALAAALKGPRPSLALLVAGLPKEHLDAYRAAGVDDFLHVRADAPAVLAALAERIGGVR